MQSNPFLMVFVSAMVTQIPVLLVQVIGIVWAIMHLSRYRSAATLALLGLVLMLLVSVGATALQQYMLIRQNTFEPQKLSMSLGVLGFTSSGGRAVALGLLLVAVFAGRNDEQRPFK